MKKSQIPQKLIILEISVQKGLVALFFTLRRYLEKSIDLERVIRLSVLLTNNVVGKNCKFVHEIENLCKLQQKQDGGWVGVEDSVWCVAFLKAFEACSRQFTCGLDWLKNQQLECGGWGKSGRDVGRIPITGTLLFLLPELSNKESLAWLESEWKKDFVSNPKLTYKAAFTLMALKSCNHRFVDESLFVDTLDWLACEQNDDGGWGPWKNHPVGSTPFCTGLALVGLLQFPDLVDSNVVEKGLKWLVDNQLPEGLWPDHYIEEGSVWSFYALTEGYKFLKEKQ